MLEWVQMLTHLYKMILRIPRICKAEKDNPKYLLKMYTCFIFQPSQDAESDFGTRREHRFIAEINYSTFHQEETAPIWPANTSRDCGFNI